MSASYGLRNCRWDICIISPFQMPGGYTIRQTETHKKKNPLYFTCPVCLHSFACCDVISPYNFFLIYIKRQVLESTNRSTLTQTLMLLIVCYFVTSEPVIAHSTHLLTPFRLNHSLLLGVCFRSVQDVITNNTPVNI